MKILKTIFAAAIMTIAAYSQANAEGFITPVETTGVEGATTVMAIDMNNDEMQVIAFEFSLMLPQEVSVPVDEYGDLDIQLTDRANRTHVLTANRTDNGTIRVVVYSSKNTAFTGRDGAILECTISLDGAPGSYTAIISDVIVTDADRKEHEYPSAMASINIESTSGINDIYTDCSKKKIYDMQGRQVSVPSHGMFIANGKKVRVPK